MEIQKVYVNERNEATVICQSCGKSRVINAEKYKETNRPIKVKCSCAFSFSITFEKRKHYRKRVTLFGSYSRTGDSQQAEDIIVTDISRTGVGFKTSQRGPIQAEEVLKVKFTLDDHNKSTIVQNVVVKRVTPIQESNEQSVGAEFCDANIPKQLVFYLMP